MSGYHIHSLKDLIQFNQQDPKVRMKYGQSIFEAAENTSGTLREEHYHQVYQENLDKANLMTRLLKKHDLISVASVIRTGFAPIAGNPVVAVVAKELVDDQPQSMYFIGEHFSDPQLLRVAYVYEQATQKRVAPDLDHIR
jgi:amidase